MLGVDEIEVPPRNAAQRLTYADYCRWPMEEG